MNSRSARWRSQRWTRSLLAGLLGGLLMVIGPWSPLWASPAPIRASGPPAIPLREQPFYPELLAAAARWSDDPLGQVVGESPRETLLNFYAVMARVDNEIEIATRNPQQDPGLSWSPAARQRIDAAQQLFALAVQALDASTFPKSVRDDMADEAAMQLKEVLDYVFTHSTVPITIPDSAGLKTLNNQRSQASQNWTLGDTAITLTSEASKQEGSPSFVFSAGTVSQVGRMYGEINHKPTVEQPFATPDLYNSYIYTPGYLAPPKWYLRLPADVRRVMEVAVDGQTLLQLCAVLATLLLYGWIVLIISRRLFYTYSYWLNDEKTSLRAWHQDNMAWYRVLLVLPMLPLTKLSEIFIDDYVNFTGTPLVVVTYLFFICYFVASSFFSFFLFEALGRSTSEWMVQLRGGGSSSDLQLRRVSNLVMPLCRALGGLVATVLIYRLLIALGLPSTTVLAFSAVPGLAIGLGASKLLGNLFAGLSIQTDRPLRVGEFCRIGDNLGYITKIGLRSLELQTLESRVTIPNAIADEETIVNFSRRSPNSAATPMQSLHVQLTIEQKLSPEQVNDLLHLVRRHVAGCGDLLEPLVSIEQKQTDELTLICFAMVTLQDWSAYLSIREALLMRLQQLLDQVRLSTIILGVSYDTTPEQLRQLPDLIRSVVNSEPLVEMQSCRFMTINTFTYDIVIRLHANHTNFAAFKNAIHQLNQALLIALAAAQIEIPFPTQMQLQRNA